PYMSTVIRQLRADPQAQLFIWFVLQDSQQNLWKSGLVGSSGGRKPAYRTFTNLAAETAGETQTIKAGLPPLVTLAVPRLAYQSPPGETVGITYTVSDGSTLVTAAQPTATLG